MTSAFPSSVEYMHSKITFELLGENTFSIELLIFFVNLKSEAQLFQLMFLLCSCAPLFIEVCGKIFSGGEKHVHTGTHKELWNNNFSRI